MHDYFAYGLAIGAVFTPLAIVVIILLFLKRKNNILRVRNPVFLLVMSCGNAIIASIVAFYIGLREDLPCDVLYLFQWLAFPFMVYPFVMRCWEYCVSFRIANSRTLLDSNKFLGDSKETTAEGEELKVERRRSTDNLKSWFVRNKHTGDAAYLVKIYMYSFWVVCLPIVPVLIATSLDKDFVASKNRVCQLASSALILFIIGVIAAISVMIVLAALLRHAKDAFHIRHEIIALAVSWIFVGPPLIGISQKRISTVFIPATLLLIGLLITFLITSVYPLCLVYIDENRKKQQNQDSANDFTAFQAQLDLPAFRNIFFQFLSLQFCSENLIFYEVATNWKAKMERKSSNDESRATQAISIYDNFIASSGEYEINVSSGIKKKIMESIAHREYPDDLYNAAINEVLDMMYSNSYYVFLKSTLAAHSPRNSSILLRENSV